MGSRVLITAGCYQTHQHTFIHISVRRDQRHLQSVLNTGVFKLLSRSRLWIRLI